MWWLLLSTAAVASANLLAVELDSNVTPQQFAIEHGLLYNGTVGALSHIHLFTHAENTVGARSADVSSSLRGARWMERQVTRKRVTRSDPLYGAQWHLHGTHSVQAPVAWRRGYTGSGVTIAIVDDGLQHSHADLRAQYAAQDSWDYNGNKADPTPTSRQDSHGTSCAGVCCAQWNNNVCGTGVCPNCRVAGIRLIAAGVSDVTEALALSHRSQHVDIYSCSWGPPDDGQRLDGPGRVLQDMFEHQALNGRNGRGSIFMWAGGNGRAAGDNCNYDGYANNRHTLAIGALDSVGSQSWYSESCSALIAVAPSSGQKGITTVALDDKCTSRFGGTSSATPLAAGIVAMMLEARPDLTWRDVQHVVARGSTHIRPSCSSWSVRNARGYQHSERYGFGLLVVPRLIDAALAHTLVGPQTVLCDTNLVYSGRAFPTTLSFNCHNGGDWPNSFVEHVDVEVHWEHPCRGELSLTLSNELGVANSHLARVHSDCTNGVFSWRFGSMRHWGEKLARTWTLRGSNSTRGKLLDARLVVHGTRTTTV